MYVQSVTLLLGDVFEIFKNNSLEIYELGSAHFCSAAGLAWQTALKKTKVELEISTDIDILLMVEKGINQREYGMVFIFMQKIITNTLNIMVKTKDYHI